MSFGLGRGAGGAEVARVDAMTLGIGVVADSLGGPAVVAWLVRWPAHKPAAHPCVLALCIRFFIASMRASERLSASCTRGGIGRERSGMGRSIRTSGYLHGHAYSSVLVTLMAPSPA